MDWTELLKKTTITKSDEDVGSWKVIADATPDEDKKPGNMLLAEAKVYFPSTRVGDEITFPPLWTFHFPIPEDKYKDILPTTMGEHGDTKEEAIKLVVERLNALVDSSPKV